MVKDENFVFSKFKPIKVLLIGDYMLDQYTYGDIYRISPEAPVPILNIDKKNSMPGGAGNVALNLLELGAKVDLLGRIGEDKEGKELLSILEKSKLNTENLIEQKHCPTILKNRLIAESQQVLRVDFEKILPLSKDLEEKIIKKLPNLIKDKQVIAISDYGKGFLSKKLLFEIIRISKDFNVPTIIDPKGEDFSKYRGASILKPN